MTPMTVHLVLLSPKVAELVDEPMARYLAAQLDAVTARPPEKVALRRGTIDAWGVEITAEDGARAYRVAFVLEEEDDIGNAVLSICAMEERTQLEAPLRRRKNLKGWRQVPVITHEAP
jgi:hypothetical protein